MKVVQTYTATLYVGAKEHNDGTIHSVEEAEELCQKYCDEVGLCVTVTPTMYVYTNGKEEGFIIGLINYPRFPSYPSEILNHAVNLGNLLMRTFWQYNVTIVLPDRTYMLENEHADDKYNI